MNEMLEVKELHTDVLIIGGGTAGCYAALTISRNSDLNVIITEKAHIKRSGCLAAGVNAINAYITKGRKPEDYAAYAAKDANGIVRHDLLLTAARRFNDITADLERLGLVILKDENGEYVARGNRNIKINGENIKPILAAAVEREETISILNRVNITGLLVAHEVVYGAVGFSVTDRIAYIIYASKVLIATGGAAGLYKPNNPGYSRHKMWYPPFNTGAGYAMGIQAGAEMTTFEMRFIALRCKDTIAPTGTIAQGVRAKQVNAQGEVYESKYGITTSERVYGTVMENIEGRGPCYLKTNGIQEKQSEDLLKAYLNMAPAQTLKWVESGKLPHEQDVEIAGTEPYIVGGHTASGFWVNTNRETTIHGLYAAGDVAGGCPQKYVTGALAEGEIAAFDIINKLTEEDSSVKKVIADKVKVDKGEAAEGEAAEAEADKVKADKGEADKAEADKVKAHEVRADKTEAKKAEEKTADGGTENKISKEIIHAKAESMIAEIQRILSGASGPYSVEELEEAMQKVMDEFAGGIAVNYRFNERQLKLAYDRIGQLGILAEKLSAKDMHELLFVYELKERLTVCRSLIAHLAARRETRWHSFNENLDYPETDDTFYGYVNSRYEDGTLKLFFRKLVTEDTYEHEKEAPERELTMFQAEPESGSRKEIFRNQKADEAEREAQE